MPRDSVCDLPALRLLDVLVDGKGGALVRAAQDFAHRG